MSRSYSNEFVNELSARLNKHSESSINRHFCNSFVMKKIKGYTVNYLDLTRDVLERLCVQELCPDGLIASVFGTSKEAVEALRELYGLDDKTIIKRHTEYISEQLARDIETEMGEAAYN